MSKHIGLIDVDGHHFPNLALMRISAYHKSLGDNVGWYNEGAEHYDTVYMSKIFSDTYTKDIAEPQNADEIIKGGTGYQIHLNNGIETYDKDTDKRLPSEIEHMFPDYSIYPEYDYAVAMTSRGCPRGCAFCHVAAKEGKCSVKVADVKDFWDGQKEIKILDPNITACKDRFNLLEQYASTKAWCDFSQGIDARLITPEFVEALNECKIKTLHFAWDNMKQSDSVLNGLELYRRFGKIQNYRRLSVYCLTNFDTSMEENLYRVYTLRDMGYDPYIMIYDKPNAPREIRRLQYWVNNKIIFRTCDKFEDFSPETKRKRKE